MSTPPQGARIPAEARKLKGAKSALETGRAAATIQILLETAERLFAEKGVDHVSLRQIVLESGHRNVAALHYHFGSRSSLVAEVLRNRREIINVERMRQLDAIAARGGYDLRDIVATSVRPLAHAIRDTTWGAHYVSVLAQTTLSPQLRADGIGQTASSGLKRAHAMIAALLPHIDESVMQQRLVWHTHTVIYSMVHWCQTHPENDADALDRHTEELINFCVGGLLGCKPPHSD